jgi:hypothetical protein
VQVGQSASINGCGISPGRAGRRSRRSIPERWVRQRCAIIRAGWR